MVKSTVPKQEIKVDNCDRCVNKRIGLCDKFGYVINPSNKEGLSYYIIDSEECLEYKRK